MVKQVNEMSVKSLSVILGVIALVASAGFYGGKLQSTVDTNKINLEKICNRLDDIDNKINHLLNSKMKYETKSANLLKTIIPKS